MSDQRRFDYLPLLRRYKGSAIIWGGGSPSPQTKANKAARKIHSAMLQAAAQKFSQGWQSKIKQNLSLGYPDLPVGIPLLLQVDPGLELDELRKKFSFEIIAEHEDGYVIAASKDVELKLFNKMAGEFAIEVHGSATVASIHKLDDDPGQADRLVRILSDTLFVAWSSLDEGTVYTVDIGISCVGTIEIPNRPKRGKKDNDAEWAVKEGTWAQERINAYMAWDELKDERHQQIETIIGHYKGEILSIIDGSAEVSDMQDNFTIRLKIVGKGLKDFILNYPYIFEVVEPEEIDLNHNANATERQEMKAVTFVSPKSTDPAICVIDSGIQEGHVLIEHAIDSASSHCFVPGKGAKDVGDFVRPGGHGTRVAGALLYGNDVPMSGTFECPFWIQNARVLDENCSMLERLFPPLALKLIVEMYFSGNKNTRIFNHSINSRVSCRTKYMSSWASEMDSLSYSYDVLIIQSAGNLSCTGVVGRLGIKDHVNSGKAYPQYLYEDSSRIANPGQSLQAITVGSIAFGFFESGGWKTFAKQAQHPSAFTRSGLGIWNTIKPDVVEYGGDAIHNDSNLVDVMAGGIIPDSCPLLVRSTMFPPGPAIERDQVGTSFAAPLVSRIAGKIQKILPKENTLLYRALIVQSARWPNWAEKLLDKISNLSNDDPQKDQLKEKSSRIIRLIGYGKPDENRATTNTPYRTTLISRGDSEIKAGECHIYQVPIPDNMRMQSDEYEVRIEVTLSYAGKPRRTRRKMRRYLSTWVDWKSSKLRENINDFKRRAMKDDIEDDPEKSGSSIKWILSERPQFGIIPNVKRNAGTVQKDWAKVKSNSLPEDFCIAVVGHRGWSNDPDSLAKYSLVVTFEIIGNEIPIYDSMRVSIENLRSTIEVENEIEILEK